MSDNKMNDNCIKIMASNDSFKNKKITASSRTLGDDYTKTEQNKDVTLSTEDRKSVV